MSELYTVPGAAQFLGCTESNIKHHLYRSSDKLLARVAAFIGGKKREHTNVLFNREGLEWFQRVKPTRPGPRPENWLEKLLETDPPPPPPKIGG